MSAPIRLRSGGQQIRYGNNSSATAIGGLTRDPQCLKLSALAAQTLIEARELKLESLDLHRSSLLRRPLIGSDFSSGTKEYESRKKFRDPLTACAGGLFWTILQCEAGLVELFTYVLMRYRSFPN